MLVMVVFFIAFRWILLSTPLIRLFLLVLILLLMPTLNFLPVWFALSLLRFRLRLKADRKSGSAGMPRPRSTLFPYTTLFRSNQVVSVGADIAFDADPKFFACLVRFESSSVPTKTQSEPDRKSGSAGMPRPSSYAVFCLKKKKIHKRAIQELLTTNDKVLDAEQDLKYG